MHPPALWDWETGQRVVLTSMERPENCAWVEEAHASPDGERVAALASLEEGGYTAWSTANPGKTPSIKPGTRASAPMAA